MFTVYMYKHDSLFIESVHSEWSLVGILIKEIVKKEQVPSIIKHS